MTKNRVFISCSHKDWEIVEKITRVLENNDYIVIKNFDYNYDYCNNEKYKMIINKKSNIKEKFKETDILLAIITENYIHSGFAQIELSYSIFEFKKPLFAIEIGEILLPSYLNQIRIVKYKLKSLKDFNSIVFLEEISKLAISSQKALKNVSLDNEEKQRDFKNNIHEKIEFLKNALSENRLTLVCGAGVSASAGMPDWNTLLTRILNKALPSEYKKINSEDLRTLLSSSNLIVGKYLKILLKDDFDETVHKSLYDDKMSINNSKLIHNIIELIRPKRNKGSVESVINFNFDSVLEDLLHKKLNQILSCL